MNVAREVYKERKVSVSECIKKDGDVQFGCVKLAVGKNKGFIPEVGAQDEITAVRLGNGKSGLDSAEINVGQVSAEAWASPVGAGATYSVDAVNTELSFFEAKAGVCVGAEAGIRDETASVNVMGCEVNVGRKIGVGVFGCYVGVDLGRIFE